MNNQKGFFKIILIIVIALIILGAFNINVSTVVSSPTAQSNLSWFWGILSWIWSIISVPFIWVWNLLKTLLNAGLGTTF